MPSISTEIGLNQVHPKERLFLPEAVKVLRMSPCKKNLAIGTADGSISLVDLPSFQLVKTTAAHPFDVLCLAWTPDGKFLATASFEGVVKIFSSEDLNLKKEIPIGKQGINHLAWSPKFRLAVAMGSHLYVINFNDLQSHEIDCGGKSVTDLCFTIDDELIFTSYHVARLIDLKENIGQIIKQFQYPEAMLKMAVSPDRAHAAIHCQDNVVRVWSLMGGQALEMAGFHDKITLLSWSKQQLAIGCGSVVSIWNFTEHGPEGVKPQYIKAQRARIVGGEFFAERPYFITSEESGSLFLWDTSDLNQPVAFGRNKGQILQFSSDPQVPGIITGDMDGSIAWWPMSR